MTIDVIVGIILILINVPVGWGGALVCGYYGQKTGKKIFYVLSAIVYALSWVMLSLGVFLCECLSSCYYRSACFCNNFSCLQKTNI